MVQSFRAIASPPRLVARGALVLSMAAMLLGAGISSAQAQDGLIAGGLLGAGAGAIIGGATGGGKGAAKGAIIGGAAGAILGGVSESNRRRRYAPPPPPPRRVYTYAPAPGPAYGLVYDVQSSLLRLGYDPGPLDGQMGRRTADAIAAYEHDNGLLVTGQPSEALLNHMIQRGG